MNRSVSLAPQALTLLPLPLHLGGGLTCSLYGSYYKRDFQRYLCTICCPTNITSPLMCPLQESLLLLGFLPLVIRIELVLNRNFSYFMPWITDDYRIVLASIYFKLKPNKAPFFSFFQEHTRLLCFFPSCFAKYLSNGQPPCCCTEFHLHCCLFNMFSFQSIFPVQLFLLLLYVRTSCHMWESPNVCLPESSSIWVSRTDVPPPPKIDTPASSTSTHKDFGHTLIANYGGCPHLTLTSLYYAPYFHISKQVLPWQFIKIIFKPDNVLRLC